MANKQNPPPLVIEIPVPWSDRPMVVKASFWLAVVLAILTMAFAAAYMSDWNIDQIISREHALTVKVVTAIEGMASGQA